MTPSMLSILLFLHHNWQLGLGKASACSVDHVRLSFGCDPKYSPRPSRVAAIGSQPWTVLASADCGTARIELRRYELPRPNERWELDDAPILSIVMPRAEGTVGEIMIDMDDRRRHRIGRLMLRPAGVAMHSRGDGGVMDILTCRFDPVRFAAATGLGDWARVFSAVVRRSIRRR